METFLYTLLQQTQTFHNLNFKCKNWCKKKKTFHTTYITYLRRKECENGAQTECIITESKWKKKAGGFGSLVMEGLERRCQGLKLTNSFSDWPLYPFIYPSIYPFSITAPPAFWDTAVQESIPAVWGQRQSHTLDTSALYCWASSQRKRNNQSHQKIPGLGVQPAVFFLLAASCSHAFVCWKKNYNLFINRWKRKREKQ